jgi:hypothetical protein
MGAHGLPQQPHVSILHVPPIFPQVNGNAIGTAEFGQNRSGDRVRLYRATGLTNSSNVVDVDSQGRQSADS